MKKSLKIRSTEGSNRFKDSGYEESEIDNGPRCETDENYRNNENSLVDEESKEFIYLDFPKPIMKNILTPAKKVQELLTKDFGSFKTPC